MSDAVDLPIGFELTYDKGSRERALSWKSEHGLLHYAVDDGEDQTVPRYKSTPLLLNNGQPNLDRIQALIEKGGAGLPQQIRLFLADKIAAYPNNP